MKLIRRTLELDAGTGARLDAIAAERKQDVATVLAEAVALLDSVVDIADLDSEEDRRRLNEFKNTREAVPLDDIRAWAASWDSAEELPRPSPRKIG
jgi:predicted transcriptional regulator